MNAQPFGDAGPAIVAGPGTSGHLREHLDPGTDAVVLVCDAGVAATGLLDGVAAGLEGIAPLERFVAPGGEPTVATIDAAAAVARRYAAPTVVGIGGGTALDIAKLVAALQHTERDVGHYALGAATLASRSAAVMLPTTAGTGSEVTGTAVFSDGTGRKLWAWAPALVPDTVLLDPCLTRSLPPAVTVATGLDAFAHALEAVSGRSSDATVERAARAAIERATVHLGAIARAPEDLALRQRMQEAALLGGVAIDRGGTGMAHNIAHALGSRYHVSHGVAVALALEATLDWSIEGAGERFQPVADAFDGGTDVAALAARYRAWLGELDFAAVAAAALPGELDPGVLAAAMATPENAPMAGNNARPPAGDDLAELARRCVALCERYTAAPGMPA